MTILVIDNFDSFTYNLVQILGKISDDEVLVFRNNQIKLSQIKKMNPKLIVLSPGPGNPENRSDFGICQDILKYVSPNIPTLGVCLGHQGIGLVYGGIITRAKNIKHGKTSEISHNGLGLFKNIPNPITAARYHSLVITSENLPDDLEVTATSEDNEIMAIKHKRFPIFGLQFHPESILSNYGEEILQNFVEGII